MSGVLPTHSLQKDVPLARRFGCVHERLSVRGETGEQLRSGLVGELNKSPCTLALGAGWRARDTHGERSHRATDKRVTGRSPGKSWASAWQRRRDARHGLKRFNGKGEIGNRLETLLRVLLEAPGDDSLS